MKVLFLSHSPHESHLAFAHEINARIKIIPFGKYITLVKKYNFLCIFYPFLSLLYSFFLKAEEDILLVEGGSSLYVAAFLKMRNRKLRLVYFDVGLLFYDVVKSRKPLSISLKFALKMIDAVISVSEQNKQYISKFVNVPMEVRSPYPKEVKNEEIVRKNYGVYLGRLDPEKSIKRTIDFALQCPYLEKFIIVGGGLLKGYVKKMSEENEKLVYLGPSEDISKYYSECKFLIHIPNSDPHPCTTMEAAICGCYPIISRGVGTNYLFDKMFIIDNPNDFDEINRRIKYILDNEEMADELLKESIPKIQTKEQAIEDFRNKFRKITSKICEQK